MFFEEIYFQTLFDIFYLNDTGRRKNHFHNSFRYYTNNGPP